MGYYDQIQAGLDNNKTVIDEIWDRHPQMTQTEIRNALAIFLFRGEEVFKSVSALSGGERARVLLLQLMMSKANFLLLDEPTNHLDIASREALEAALMDYDGTLLVVSHDRYLINKLADRIYYLDADGTTEYIGNYDAYAERIRQSALPETETPAVSKGNGYKERKEREALLRKLRNHLKRTEQAIETLDQEITELSQQLELPEYASDYEKAMAVTAEMEEKKREQDALYQQWESLSEELEEKQAASPSFSG